MMGISHTLSGLVSGVGLVAAFPHAPLPVRVLAVAVTGGAALLPDLDHPSAKVARSLGFVTRFLARGIAAGSVVMYHATRAPSDPADREGGHRLVTHTVPGCLVPGVIVGVIAWVNPWVTGVTLALLIGLMTYGLRRFTWPILGVTAVACLWVTDQCPGWWWLWGLAVFVGALTHVVGDAMTNSGVPLLWPLTRGGKRWYKVRTPATFDTGGHVETEIVTRALTLLLLVSMGLTAGLVQPLVHAAFIAFGG